MCVIFFSFQNSSMDVIDNLLSQLKDIHMSQRSQEERAMILDNFQINARYFFCFNKD